MNFALAELIAYLRNSATQRSLVYRQSYSTRLISNPRLSRMLIENVGPEFLLLVCKLGAKKCSWLALF